MRQHHHCHQKGCERRPRSARRSIIRAMFFLNRAIELQSAELLDCARGHVLRLAVVRRDQRALHSHRDQLQDPGAEDGHVEDRRDPVDRTGRVPRHECGRRCEPDAVVERDVRSTPPSATRCVRERDSAPHRSPRHAERHLTCERCCGVKATASQFATPQMACSRRWLAQKAPKSDSEAAIRRASQTSVTTRSPEPTFF